MTVPVAQRIRNLPPYPFAEIDGLKRRQLERGVDLIDLGVGDPDRPTPRHIVDALVAAAPLASHHRYPSYVGLLELRQAAARYVRRRFGVALDPEREVVTLIGSKEGIAHLGWAVLDPGDVVLCPDPAYPVYATTARFVGAEVYPLPLRRERGFLPDLAAIPEAVLRRTRLLWLNYPNNPTAALATPELYAEAVALARRHNFAIANDLAYSEVYFDAPPPSILETEGAREVAVEFHSLSKTYNMTGWRVGYAAGNAELVGALAKVKTNVDSGVFEAVQRAAIVALDGDPGHAEEIRACYRARRDVLCDGLERLGLDVIRPAATFYCLVGCPRGETSASFATRLLERAAVVATPATAFGPGGEGFVRLTLCAEEARLREAVERLGKL